MARAAEPCPICGKMTKGTKAHIRMAHPAPKDLVTSTQPGEKPAELMHFHQPSGSANYNTGMRTVKMVRPRCEVCTDGIHTWNWYESCPHDPFFHEQELVEVHEEKEDLGDGSYRVVSSTERKVRRRAANVVQVALSPRHRMGDAIARRRRRGFKLPEELRIAPFCQYHNCFSQDLPPKWRSQRYGDYCSERHALECAIQELEITLDTNPRKRNEQLAAIAFR